MFFFKKRDKSDILETQNLENTVVINLRKGTDTWLKCSLVNHNSAAIFVINLRKGTDTNLYVFLVITLLLVINLRKGTET